MSETDRIISHIENTNYAASKCPYHFNRSCFLVLNNFDSMRYHCLYALDAIQWKSYDASRSADIPEHFYDLIVLRKDLGSEYVLPFNRHFRERSGYTVGMFHMKTGIYNAKIVTPEHFKETFYTMIVFLCAIAKRLGGTVPNLKLCSFLYTETHPILTSISSNNVNKRERFGNKEYFNIKKWTRFMKNKTSLDIIRYFKLIYPEFFKKKMKNECILNDLFDDETHKLICKNRKTCLKELVEKFLHLMPDDRVRIYIVRDWIEMLKPKNLTVDPWIVRL
ncbi:hypothetical protein AVEN_57375-1 [Araneus ventricosus]|uniref:Uncharacterized protein n=1 Tax=Araneus ventricosus TaxID=182803 RepID=A0A4Y2S770_ARAVE|nr:hypothetical protein AVEN_57375-1 [Araneus ventricosus]